MMNYLVYLSGIANVFINHVSTNSIIYKFINCIGFGLVGCCTVVIHVEDNESSLLGMVDGDRLLICTGK